MFITLEPKMFPKAASEAPFTEAVIVTNHSGEEDTNPKTIILKNKGFNLKKRDKAFRELTRK